MGAYYYYRYDTYVDSQTGEILDLCKCGPEDECPYYENWLEDGKPTHVSEGTLKTIREDYV